MVINTKKGNDIFSITDISKAFSEGNVMEQFKAEVRIYFEDNISLKRKNNYFSLKQRRGYSDESPILYKSYYSMNLYYDLLTGKFKLSISSDFNNEPSNSLTTVLVGSVTFEEFIKKHYSYNNKFIIYSEDNKHRSYHNHNQYPKLFEIVDMETVLNLLNDLFQKQYGKNLKKFLLDDDQFDMEFSANNHRKVFPFFVGRNLDYKLKIFEKNYGKFCKNYKLKDEYLFLESLYKLFQQKKIENFYDGNFTLKESVEELKKADTGINEEIERFSEMMYQNDCKSYEQKRIRINESSLVKFALDATRYYSELERTCSLHTKGFSWKKLFKEVGERISKFIIERQDDPEWYLDIFGEPYLGKTDEYINDLFVENFLVNEYSSNKKYNIDIHSVLIDIDEEYGRNIDYYFETISKILDNKVSIQLNLFHFIGTGLYTIFSGEYQSRLFFDYLFSLTDEQRKLIIFKQSEILMLKSMCENNLAISPVKFDFFERVGEFTII